MPAAKLLRQVRWTTVAPVLGIVVLAFTGTQQQSIEVLIVFVPRRGKAPSVNAKGAAQHGAVATRHSTLVLPTFPTRSRSSSAAAAIFAAVASLFVGTFVLTQTVRHRTIPPVRRRRLHRAEEHAAPPSGRDTDQLTATRGARCSGGREGGIAGDRGSVAPRFPHSFVGVVIALLVLLPETLAALRAGRRDRIQTSLNLAFGSAIASIGLTIPAIAVATIWPEGPLVLGLGSTQIVLLAVTVVVAALTVAPGRATRLQGVVHLVLLAAFVFLAISP